MGASICTSALLYMATRSHNQRFPSPLVYRALNSHDPRFALLAYSIQLLIVSPVLHVLMVRVLTSGVFWTHYHRITFMVHLPLPLQIMGIRFLMKASPVL